MKKYKFIRMTYKMLKGGYVTAKEDGYRNHRTVIKDMAVHGYLKLIVKIKTYYTDCQRQPLQSEKSDIPF